MKDLTDVEQFKIQCGEAHFEAISEQAKLLTKFNWANSYKDFKRKEGLK